MFMKANQLKSDSSVEFTPEIGGNLPEVSGDIISGPGASKGASLPVHHFLWQGREYRLFKRDPDRAAPWYFQIKKAGKRTVSSLKTPVVSVAIGKAKALLEASQRGQLAQVRAILNPRETKSTYCTVGQVLDEFDKSVLDIGEKHRTGIRSAVSVVLRTATGAADIKALSTWILNADTARRYFEACLVKAQEQESQEQSARVKRSSNSTWCQAACLFTPKLLAKYQRAGLVLPDLAPFLAVFEQEKFTKCTATYNPPSDDIIRATLRAWCKLVPAVGPYRVEDRNMFLAVGLELACGLRRNEAAQVTWSMFTRRHGFPLLEGTMTVKNQTGRLSVQPIDPFWSILQKRIKREGWRAGDQDLVLVGGKTELAEDVWRDVGTWMRALGWRTEKTNHALRAFAGCQVAMKYDTYRAQIWLRHRSVTTTQSDYGHFIKSAVFTPDKVRIRWAKR